VVATGVERDSILYSIRYACSHIFQPAEKTEKKDPFFKKSPKNKKSSTFLFSYIPQMPERKEKWSDWIKKWYLAFFGTFSVIISANDSEEVLMRFCI